MKKIKLIVDMISVAITVTLSVLLFLPILSIANGVKSAVLRYKSDFVEIKSLVNNDIIKSFKNLWSNTL